LPFDTDGQVRRSTDVWTFIKEASMKQHIHKVLNACAPVFAVVIAVHVLQVAHIAFPIALSPSAWAQWFIFAALVYTCTSFLFFLFGQVFGDKPPSSSQGLPAHQGRGA
jgi:hypothetical protein